MHNMTALTVNFTTWFTLFSGFIFQIQYKKLLMSFASHSRATSDSCLLNIRRIAVNFIAATIIQLNATKKLVLIFTLLTDQ